MNLPIRVRLTAWYTALFTATTVALSTFLVLQLRADLRQSIDYDVSIGSVELARALTKDPERDPDDPADAAEADRDFQEAARAILSPTAAGAQLLDDQGRVLVRYGTVAGGGPIITERVHAAALTGPPRTFTTPLGRHGQRYRVRVSSVQDRGVVRVVVLAESLRSVEDEVRRVLLLLLIAGPAALAITGLAAYWLASKALKPVERMTTDAQAIGIDQLNERVAVPSSHDETRRLAVTLNAMLSRIEKGVLEKHRVLADASHELRTPLAIMRTEVDVTLRADELTPAAREVLGSVREEVDRMTRTVDNLMTLGQADEGRLELLTAPVELRQVAANAVRTLRPLAAAGEVSLTVKGDRSEVQADPQRILLVLTNLVENAIKFSPAGGSVRIATWRRGDEVGVTVTDQGPGIPDADREHLFDRFYRAGATGGPHNGSGLGLAICREVIRAHGGRIWVDSGPEGGSAFSVALPGWRSL